MPFGTPGADVQTQAMLQVLLNIVDFNIPLQEAVELPRFASYDAPDSFEPHQYQRRLLKIEEDVDNRVRETLVDYGHLVSPGLAILGKLVQCVQFWINLIPGCYQEPPTLDVLV